jgi:hypothetical protein
MCTSPPSKFKVKVICRPWLKFFCSQIKVFQTALNQSVFIADLPYLAHTFTMSPPLHAHMPTVQGQDQGYLRTLVKVFFYMTRLKFLKLPQTKEFSTQTFTMSSQLHTHVCDFQGQDPRSRSDLGKHFFFFNRFAYIPYCNMFKGLCKSYCVGIGGIYVLLTYLVNFPKFFRKLSWFVKSLCLCVCVCLYVCRCVYLYV